MKRALTRPKDFRLLPILVVVSLAMMLFVVWSARRLAPRLFGVAAVAVTARCVA